MKEEFSKTLNVFCYAFQVDISAHVAYVMAAKEDSELSQVKVSIVYKLLILLLCIVYIYIQRQGGQKPVIIILNLKLNTNFPMASYRVKYSMFKN